MSLLVFVGVNVVGDPVDMLINPEADQAEIDRVIRHFGLDKPIHMQYWHFLTNALQGDLGKSFIFGMPALQLILMRMPATLELAFSALILAIVIGIPLGVYAGLKAEARVSRTIMASSILGFSLPTFWVGLMMIMVFAVMLGWLPSTGRGETVMVGGMELSFLTLDGLSHLLMPALNLSLFKMSLVIRLARAGTREVVHQDYMKFARAKGLSESRLIMVHLLKNIMIPVVTVLGLELGGLIAFSVVTETVFAWPGIGRLMFEALMQRDYNLLLGIFFFSAALVIVFNIITDLVYGLVDPRIKETS